MVLYMHYILSFLVKYPTLYRSNLSYTVTCEYYILLDYQTRNRQKQRKGLIYYTYEFFNSNVIQNAKCNGTRGWHHKVNASLC